jgi:hypothetical protein
MINADSQSSRPGSTRLNATKLQELHRTFPDLWNQWRESIPEDWHSHCPLLSTSSPVAVTIDFGQNQELWSVIPNKAKSLRDNFLSLADWTTVRNFDFALAASYL